MTLCARKCPVSCIAGKVKEPHVIDQSKCIKCGKCRDACSYQAIIKFTRPCQEACGMHAIGQDEHGRADIDYDKCVNCGLCEKHCNFLAIYRDGQNKVTVNEDLCRGCQACETFCKSDAIHLELVDPSVLAPLDVKALKAQQNA